MINEMELLDWNIVLQPFLAIIILLILLIIMMILCLKTRLFLPILVVFLFSLIIGFNSIALENIPLNPYLSIFFILFQSVMFIETSLQQYKTTKRLNKYE